MQREGKVFLVKNCPSCGLTETLISSHARRYTTKHSLAATNHSQDCRLDFRHCEHRQRPKVILIDVTNRCNLNCPICLESISSMGFVFQPPIEYFDRIFKHFAEYDPRPYVDISGGEPTLRSDLFDIIKLSKSYGYATRVVTNGLKLANEAYCRKLIESGVTILFSYDGSNPETYRLLRGNARALQLKQKALENLDRIGGANVILTTLIAKGLNDHELPELLQFCHERRHYIRGLYLFPLAHIWDITKFDFAPERINTEDVESLVEESFPDSTAEFLPVDFLSQIPTVMRCLRMRPLPAGVRHPNCESLYILLSDGKSYVPISRYLRTSMPEIARALLTAEKRLTPQRNAMGERLSGTISPKSRWEQKVAWLRSTAPLMPILLRHIKMGPLLKGKGPLKVLHTFLLGVEFVLGRNLRDVILRHTELRGVMEVLVMPMQDDATLQTERLAQCPVVSTFLDPATGEVKYISSCAWRLYNSAILRNIAAHYAVRAPKIA
ncbi:MAG: hypothetical protein AMS15_00950 [Planctomycetes bacterium DG_23]|nr:MAG: hypothetical protein AMS15_00950 [Planctomycetes bacterium DG_23]